MVSPQTQGPPTMSMGTDSSQPSSEMPSDHHDLPPTSSLLFGFLISFLALFIVFMGCGLTSRYMFDRRRQRALTESDLYGGLTRGSMPKMWDVWAVPGEHAWKDMMPLAAQIQKEMPNPALTRAAQVAQQQRPISMLYHQTREQTARLIASSWRRSHMDSSSRPSRPRETDGKLDHLQIAVLVAMPCPHVRKSVEREGEHLEEQVGGGGGGPTSLGDIREDRMADLAVGTTTVPWDKQRSGFG